MANLLYKSISLPHTFVTYRLTLTLLFLHNWIRYIVLHYIAQSAGSIFTWKKAQYNNIFKIHKIIIIVNTLHVLAIHSLCSGVLNLLFFTLCSCLVCMFHWAGTEQVNYLSCNIQVPLDSKLLTLITYRLAISTITHTRVVHRIACLLIRLIYTIQIYLAMLIFRLLIPVLQMKDSAQYRQSSSYDGNQFRLTRMCSVIRKHTTTVKLGGLPHLLSVKLQVLYSDFAVFLSCSGKLCKWHHKLC